MTDQICEGDCEECVEPVEHVHVVDTKGQQIDWGNFWYCQVAIKEDEKRGFKVTKVLTSDSESV